MFFAETIVYAVFIYLGLGVLFAIWFAAAGVVKLDDSARGTGLGFRFIIFFGAAAFWVLLAWRIAKGAKRPVEKKRPSHGAGKMIHKIRRKHKIVWLILAILLPVLFIVSIIFRHHEPINENIPKRILPQDSQR